MMKDDNGLYHSNPEDMAAILKNHWQQVFDQKRTDPCLRASWLRGVANRLHSTMEQLRPTMADVNAVFDHLHESAPGPDGIPSSLFAKL
eukprot:120894-Karenia_brevis.AAC.1